MRNGVSQKAAGRMRRKSHWRALCAAIFAQGNADSVSQIIGRGVSVMPQIDVLATGARIKALAGEKGLKVTDIQRECGLGTPQTVFKWFRGATVPSIDNLVNLAGLFEVGLDDIVVYSEKGDGNVKGVSRS